MSFPDKNQSPPEFDDRHHSLGATIAPYQTSRAVLSYGDSSKEALAAVERVAILEFPIADVLEIQGKHAQRFLHGLVTSDIKGMQNGTSSWSTALNRKGRLVTDFTVWCHDEKNYRLVAPGGRGKDLGEHLTQHRVAERVDIEWSEDNYSQLLVIGPEANEILGTEETLGTWECAGISVAHAPGPDLKLPCKALLVKHADVSAVWTELTSKGACPIGTEAYDALRIEAGHPLFGIEALEDRMPIEVGMDATVSFLKGCYVGQEVIAMATYRGHPNRKLMGVIFPEANAPPDAGVELSFENGKSGVLTTSGLPSAPSYRSIRLVPSIASGR